MMTRRVVSCVAAFLLIASISMAAGTASFGYWVSDGVAPRDTEWTNSANWVLDPGGANYPADTAQVVIQDSTATAFPVIADGQDYVVDLLTFNWWGPTAGKTAELTVESGGKIAGATWLLTNMGGVDTGFHSIGDVVITVETGGILDAQNIRMGQAGTSTTIYTDGTSTIGTLDMKDGDNLIILGDNAQIWLMTYWWNAFGNDVLLNDKIVAENEVPGIGVTKILQDENWTVLGVGALDYSELQILADGDMASGLNGAAGETGPPAWYLYDYRLNEPEFGFSLQTVAYTESDASVGIRSIEFILSDYAAAEDFKASATNSNYAVPAGELYRMEFDYKTIGFEQRNNPDTGDPEGSDALVFIRFFDAAVAQIGGPVVFALQDTDGQWVSAETSPVVAPEDTAFLDVAIWGSLFGNSKGTIRIDNFKLYQSFLEEYVGAEITTWQPNPNGPAPTDWNRAANWSAGRPGTGSLALFGWVFAIEGETFANPLAVIDEPVLPFAALGMGWWDSMGNEPNQVALDWEIQITDGGEMTILDWFWMGAGAETTNTLTVDGGSLTVPSLDVARAFGSEATVYHSGGEVNVTAWLNFGGGDGVYYISNDAVLTLAGDQRSYVLDQLVPWGYLVPILAGEEELLVEFDGANTIISIGVPVCGVYLDADLNRDCVVDVEDLLLLVTEWLDPGFTEWIADMSVDPVTLPNFYRRDGLDFADEYTISDGTMFIESGFAGDINVVVDTFPLQVFDGIIEVEASWRATQVFNVGSSGVGPPVIFVPTQTDQNMMGFARFMIIKPNTGQQDLAVVINESTQPIRLTGFDPDAFVQFRAVVDTVTNAPQTTVTIIEATDGMTTYTDVSHTYSNGVGGPAGPTFLTLAAHGVAGEVDYIEFRADRALMYDLTGDNEVNLADFAVLASDWLNGTIGQFE